MSRLPYIDPATATGPAAAVLADVQKMFGVIPNTSKVMANSPALLSGLLGLSTALNGGVLSASVRVLLAMAIGEYNGCSYCLSAHSYVATNVMHLDAEEVERARRAESSDAHTGAILALCDAIVRGRGHIEDSALAAARDAGVTDAEVAEIVGHIALNVLTNYFNIVADVETEWPVVTPYSHARR
jgi:uncharacterized peroxidase-related enzyme